MLLRHGGLAIDLPETWQDQSSLLFVAPPRTGELPTTAKVQRDREAVAVSFVEDDPPDARAALMRQAEALETLDPSFAVLKEEPFHCGLGTGVAFTQRLTIEGVVARQLAVACVVGSMTVMATAAAAELQFDRAEGRLRQILESLRPMTTG